MKFNLPAVATLHFHIFFSSTISSHYLSVVFIMMSFLDLSVFIARLSRGACFDMILSLRSFNICSK